MFVPYDQFTPSTEVMYLPIYEAFGDIPTITNPVDDTPILDAYIFAEGIDAGVVQVDPLLDTAESGLLLASLPIATNNPEEFTAIELVYAVAEEPFILAGVVQLEPSEDTAYKGALMLSVPTATNKPDELTVIAHILATTVEPFIKDGFDQVDPSLDVEYMGC